MDLIIYLFIAYQEHVDLFAHTFTVVRLNLILYQIILLVL